LFIDGWAHNHGQVDDSFFTPWHALLYGAMGLAGLILIATHSHNALRMGYRWSRALPHGYALSLIGFFAFGLAGLGDMLWHETFGFESGTEALLSPTHLVLALSGLLVITGPIRSLWQRRLDGSWRSFLPALLCFSSIAAIFTFFTAFAAVTGRMSVMVGERPEFHYLHDATAVMAFIAHSNILLGVTLFMLRRWRLPFGALTLLYGVNGVLMSWLHVGDNAEFLFALSATAVGFLGDLLLQRGGEQGVAAQRAFAFLMPLVYCLAAVLVIHILGTTVWGGASLWWEIHMWLGVPIMAGAFGFCLSLLVQPPAIPAATS